MQRRCMKFFDLEAQLGGLFKILALIGFVIVYPFAKISLNKEIVNSIFEFSLNRNAQKSVSVNQGNCLLETNFIGFQEKLNEKKDKNCKQIYQVNQNFQKLKKNVNQSVEDQSLFDHVLDNTNNKNIQNCSLQNQKVQPKSQLQVALIIMKKI
ncbi:hypothetical protein ABPG72_006816 [Tetrahymena utriculariae]